MCYFQSMQFKCSGCTENWLETKIFLLQALNEPSWVWMQATPEHLCSSSLCGAIGGWSRGVLFFKVHSLTQEFSAPCTYSVIINSLHIHNLMGGGRTGGVQRPWSAGLMPQEQSGFSVLLKVSATTDMYAHWQSNHWAPLLPEWLDSIKQQSHLNNESVKQKERLKWKHQALHLNSNYCILEKKRKQKKKLGLSPLHLLPSLKEPS